jgi:peptidyl-prolyl cis-trans isomerase C
MAGRRARPKGAAVAWVLVTAAAVSATEEVVARVGDRVVSRRMLDAAVAQGLNARYVHRDLGDDKRRRLERDQLEALIRRELNLLGALDRGIKPDREAAEARRRAVEERLGSAEYVARLRAENLTRPRHRRLIADTMLAEEAHRRFVVEPSRVGDDELRAAFEADRERWQVPESLHLEHILLRVEPGASAEARAARALEAHEIVTQLRGGTSFADLAASHSQDMYRIKGGDLGWVHRGRLVEPLESAVWETATGAVVGPVWGAEGWHIARVVDRRAERAMSFDEAAPVLRRELEEQRSAAAERAFFAEVASRHPVAILDASLEDARPDTL